MLEIQSLCMLERDLVAMEKRTVSLFTGVSMTITKGSISNGLIVLSSLTSSVEVNVKNWSSVQLLKLPLHCWRFHLANTKLSKQMMICSISAKLGKPSVEPNTKSMLTL